MSESGQKKTTIPETPAVPEGPKKTAAPSKKTGTGTGRKRQNTRPYSKEWAAFVAFIKSWQGITSGLVACLSPSVLKYIGGMPLAQVDIADDGLATGAFVFEPALVTGSAAVLTLFVVVAVFFGRYAIQRWSRQAILGLSVGLLVAGFVRRPPAIE